MRQSEAELELWRVLDQRRTPGAIIARKGALRMGDYWLHTFERPSDAEFLAQTVHVVVSAFEELQTVRQQLEQLRLQLAASDKPGPGGSGPVRLEQSAGLQPPLRAESRSDPIGEQQCIAQIEQRISEQSAIIARQQAELKAQNALLARYIQNGNLWTTPDGSLWQVVWRETRFTEDER